MSPSFKSLHSEDFYAATKAVRQIRHQIKSCSCVAVYSFNVHQSELELAYVLVDKLNSRKNMRITYNDEYNFVIKYMPSTAHVISHNFWTFSLIASLVLLSGGDSMISTGCTLFGATRFTLSPGKNKEADASVCPPDTNSPTVVVEVGDSECLSQLRCDARGWLESMLLHVQLVVIICIDPPRAPHLTLPRITIQHWKSVLSTRAGNHAQMVWHADWTHATTPNYYVPLMDLFLPGAIPPIYGGATMAVFNDSDVAHWRQNVINNWH